MLRNLLPIGAACGLALTLSGCVAYPGYPAYAYTGVPVAQGTAPAPATTAPAPVYAAPAYVPDYYAYPPAYAYGYGPAVVGGFVIGGGCCGGHYGGWGGGWHGGGGHWH